MKCTDPNNPPESTDAGRVICEVGVQPPYPAEFVVIVIGKTQNVIEVLQESRAIHDLRLPPAGAKPQRSVISDVSPLSSTDTPRGDRPALAACAVPCAAICCFVMNLQARPCFLVRGTAGGSISEYPA